MFLQESFATNVITFTKKRLGIRLDKVREVSKFGAVVVHLPCARFRVIHKRTSATRCSTLESARQALKIWLFSNGSLRDSKRGHFSHFTQVVDKDLVESGLSVGDVVAQVGEWSAQGATIVQVVAQINKHKKRPLEITFATPDLEQDEDEFIF